MKHHVARILFAFQILFITFSFLFISIDQVSAAGLRYKLSGLAQPANGYSSPSAACLTGGPYHDSYYGVPGCHSWQFVSSTLCHFEHNTCGGAGDVAIYSFCPAGTICVSATKNNGNVGQCMIFAGTNPINIATGNKFETEMDYQGVGDASLQLLRYYNSDSDTESANWGQQWRSTYDRSIMITSSTAVTIYRADGKSYDFTQAGGIWSSDADVNEQLVELTSGGTTTGWELTNTSDEIEIYDAQGKLTQIEFRGGFTHTFTYDSSNRLSTVTDSFARQLSFTYNANDQVISMTDPASGTYLYSYDANDNLDQVTYPDNTTRVYHYEDTNFVHALTGITDENGHRYATWAYDTSGRATSSEHAGNVDQYTITYNSDGTRTVTDPLGKNRTYDITVINDVAKVASVDQGVCGSCGNTANYSYDNNGNIVATIDQNGRSATYTYNARGLQLTRYEGEEYSNAKLVGLAQPAQGYNSRAEACLVGGPYHDNFYGAPGCHTWEYPGGNICNFNPGTCGGSGSTSISGTLQQVGRTITTEWHASYRLPTKIINDDKETTFTYNSNGQLLTRTEKDLITNNTRTTTYTYTTNGLLTSIDGPRTDVTDTTTYAYDTSGNLTSVTDALGQVTQITSHDSHGRPLTTLDPNGVTTTLSYDARGRVLTQSVAGALTDFDYDNAGNITRITLPNGAYLNYGYDNAQRITALSDNLNNRIEYTLDAIGNRTQEDIKDPNGTLKHTRSRVYNNLNQLMQDVGASGQTTDYGYDGNGNRISVTDANQNATTSAFDALNRLVKTTDANNKDTEYTYGTRDNLTSVKDARNLTTQYTYDNLDNLAQLNSPDTGITSYTYDEAGNRITQTDANNITTNYSYDALNRLTSITYPNTTLNVTYTYDAGTNGKGRLTGITDASGSTTYTYDTRGNLLTETKTILSVSYTTQYSYDNADNLTSIIYPSGRTVNYIRNSIGQITQVQTTQGSTQTIASNISYLPFGPMQSLTFGNNIALTNTFDQDYRLTHQIAGSVHNLTYTYNNIDNITAITNNNNATRNQTFGYDALSRLTSGNGIYGNYSYTYDEVGNRITETKGSNTDTYTYSGTSNRLNAISGTTSENFGYDANGNITTTSNQTFQYNHANRMSQITAGGQTTTYTYNGKGERVIKTTPSTTTIYHFDQSGNLIAETDNTGTTQVEYVYLSGQRLALINSTGTYYIHSNHLDTPQVITDGSKTVVWSADYEPFGTTNFTVSTLTNHLRFPGQYFDAESGLHYNYFRDYNPGLGRYMQSDPIGLAGGLNTYNYVLQNPVRMIDFFGLTADCPVCPPIGDPAWIPYSNTGDPAVFHCNYLGFHENRSPTPDDPIAECFYDEENNIVDENHEYAGCRGTPNQFPSDDLRHFYPDSGGIYENAIEGFIESGRRRNDQLRERGCYIFKGNLICN